MCQHQPMSQNAHVVDPSPRGRIVDAAFALFAERGYGETSVADLAAAAGVGRSTFFRHFGSKESVICPDHDALLASVEQRLRTTTESSALKAVADAVRIVLFHYVDEGERARRRYRLTRAVPALRDRELVEVARYQRLFRRYINQWADGSEPGELRAEMMAAAVVAAHNRVLRQWLRGEQDDPHAAIDHTLGTVVATFSAPAAAEPVLLVVPEGVSLDAVASAVQRHVAEVARDGS